MKKRVETLPFRAWLLQQVRREDIVGALARDVATEERRIGRELKFNERVDIALYARAIPPAAGVTVNDALAAWAEYEKSLMGDNPSKSLKLSLSKPPASLRGIKRR